MTKTPSDIRPVTFDLMASNPDYYIILTEALREFAARERGDAEDGQQVELSTRRAEAAEAMLAEVEAALSRTGVSGIEWGVRSPDKYVDTGLTHDGSPGDERAARALLEGYRRICGDKAALVYREIGPWKEAPDA